MASRRTTTTTRVEPVRLTGVDRRAANLQIVGELAQQRRRVRQRQPRVMYEQVPVQVQQVQQPARRQRPRNQRVQNGPRVNTDTLASGPVTEMASMWNANQRRRQKVPKSQRGLPIGLTSVGRMAAIKALHPAADLGPQRWPDKAADNTLVMQNTDTWVVGSPNPDDPSGWSAIMWLTGFVDCPVIIHRQAGTAPFHDPNSEMDTSHTAAWPTPQMFQFMYSSQWSNEQGRHPAQDFQTVRITARSLTVDLIANALGNQGVCYAGQFTPNITLMPEVGGPSFRGLTSVLAKLMSRLDIDPVTVCDEADEQDDADVTIVTSLLKKYKPLVELPVDPLDVVDSGPTGVKGSRRVGAPSGGQSGSRAVFQDFPNTTQQVAQMDPKGYVAKATDGVYLPLRRCSDVLEYQETAKECYLSASVPHVENSFTSGMNVLITKGLTMGCVIFQGLDSKASLNLKAITALELTARSDSNLVKFTAQAPPLDKLVPVQVRKAEGKLPSAFPAKYNALGTVMTWVMKALGDTEIPVVSSVAKWLHGANQSLGGAPAAMLDLIV